MSKHHQKKFQRITAIAALSATMTMGPLAATAQSGSRICGWRAATPKGEIGIVYEGRDNDAAYTSMCDSAINAAKSSIDKDTYLRPLPWVKERKRTCESVGAYFQSASTPSSDMCDRMEARCTYKVVKDNATNTTTYTKLGCTSNWAGLFDSLNLGSALNPLFNFIHDVGSTLDPAILVRDLTASLQSVYATFRDEVLDGYEMTVNAIESIIDDAMQAAYEAAADLAIDRYRSFLTNLQNRMMGLDATGKAAVNRISTALLAGQLDENVRADLALLASKLGLAANTVGSILPSGVTHSSWGVYVGGGAAYYGGIDANVGVVMNTSMTGSRYPVGLTLSAGGVVGVAFGASGGMGIFWQPGTVAESAGGYIGLGVEATLGVGVDLGVSWGVGLDMFELDNAIPSFSLGFGVGGEVKIGTLEGGYTALLKTLN